MDADLGVIFSSRLDALKKAPTARDAKEAADAISLQVSEAGLQSLESYKVIETLLSFAANKKSGYERESAGLGFEKLASALGPPAAPLLLPTLAPITELCMDKGEVVVISASAAAQKIVKIVPPEGTRIVCGVLANIVEEGKWKAKVKALNFIRTWVAGAKEQVARCLGDILPKVEKAMHDTKSEVASAAKKCATALYTTVANPDIAPHIPILVSCAADPAEVGEAMKALSSTTFIAEVTAPALVILAPLLVRALNERSMETQRRAVVVIDNLVKLVRDEKVAAMYLSGLFPGVIKIKDSASFPEVRAFAEAAYKTLLKSGASPNGPPTSSRDFQADEKFAYDNLVALLPDDLVDSTAQGPTPKHSLLQTSLKFQASSVSDLLYYEEYSDQQAWKRSIGDIIKPWFSASSHPTPEAFSETARLHFLAIHKAKYAPAVAAGDEHEEVLCDTLFSLAYGTLLLLSHTTLRLVRGHCYGILGPNGSGKTTLMRQLKEGKVENFPSQDELKCVMVEHSLQGEDTSLSVVDFVASDPALKNVKRSQIQDQLKEVGFDDQRQKDLVGGLSGGWKMRLELARAMLYHADLLLLDEPTNHLDVNSVKWLVDYLKKQKNVTCLIVSHDSGFLDNVTTDIIHYESKKLVYYPGNLSHFVELHPEAKSYYTLAATSVKFSFPPPGSLMGVRSNTRAILKMTDCTFTYPGRDTPSLHNVSCALSLSSRVGIVGPNGAGKSTLVKLLTGETSPQTGSVYKHPALRIGYVSQHATHHIEKHLEKTPIGYIQWRFQDGHDRELMEKATRVLTEEEKAELEIPFVGKNGEKRKLEIIMGRQKLKKSFQYEIKWRGLDHKFNTWIPREQLLAKGLTKLVQQFDDLESSREGASQRDTAAHIVREHLEDIGLNGDIAQYNEISGLSGGQKIKLVIAACLWNNPQICILDEPTNFLDREALGGLAVAIREWGGAVIIISHNSEFVNSLCPEIWHVDSGRLTHKGKAAIIEDVLEKKTPRTSRLNTPILSRNLTPVASANATPAGSGAEDLPSAVATGLAAAVVPKKKKLTRNQLKAREERRRLRHIAWLTNGGPKPEDSDDD